MNLKEKIKNLDNNLKNSLLDDQIGTKPNENRTLSLGISIPASLGLISSGMSLYLRFTSYDDHYAIFTGFFIFPIYILYMQIITRKAIQLKNKQRRVLLLIRINK